MQQGWQAYLYDRANPKHTFPLKSEEKDLVQLEYQIDVESYLNSSQKRKLESGTCLLRLLSSSAPVFWVFQSFDCFHSFCFYDSKSIKAVTKWLPLPGSHSTIASEGPLQHRMGYSDQTSKAKILLEFYRVLAHPNPVFLVNLYTFFFSFLCAHRINLTCHTWLLSCKRNLGTGYSFLSLENLIFSKLERMVDP
jgi:hypothetical protein